MDLFALRKPFVDFDIEFAGPGRQSISLYTESGYAGHLTLEVSEARKVLNMITMNDPCVELEDGDATKHGSYVGPLLGDDYRRYHTEDFE